MNFVRGQSTDTASKGERYHMSRAGAPPRGSAPAGRKRAPDDEDAFFDEDDDEAPPAGGPAAEDDDPLDAYMRELGGGGPAAKRPCVPEASAAAEEDDPLDAYMAGLAPEASGGGGRPQQCDEQEDHAASFLEEQERRGRDADGHGCSGDEDVGGGGAARRGEHKGKQKGKMDLLPPMDHSSIAYAPVLKNFYVEHPSVSAMSDAAVGDVRRRLRLRCSGFDVPRPIRRFGEAGLGEALDGAVGRCGFEAPTPIQCAALPVALGGRDLIGIASTGSGKTAAYTLPVLRHVAGQPALGKGDGPIGLILAPTHELAEQIVREARRLGRATGVRVVSLIGGVGKYEQLKELRAGAEVAVGTPGRMLELAGNSRAGLRTGRVSFVVIDEADRMFSMGFEPQVLFENKKGRWDGGAGVGGEQTRKGRGER